MKIERTGLRAATVETEGAKFQAALVNKGGRIVAVVAIAWNVANTAACQPLGITKDFEVETDFSEAEFIKGTWAAQQIAVDDDEYRDEMRFASKESVQNIPLNSLSAQFDENDVQQFSY